MVTTQNLVKEELQKNILFLDLIQQDLVNINALALKLHPIIETSLNKKIKVSAVSMAIRRVSENFSRNKIFDWKFPTNLEVSTRSEIYEVAIKRDSDLSELLIKIRSKLGNQIGTFLSVVDANYETVLLTNQYNKSALKTILKNKKITSEKDNLGYVTINFEGYTKDVPGIYYQITRALALRNISIQSMHTLGSEVILLFKNGILIKAYETIKSLIDNKPLF
ncbi:hypothetical protein J4216_02810 [Candidatus Woesearchaeota archaeon]|nr:hypothetical protein [Candidatus Woesearchaeota archaeon]